MSTPTHLYLSVFHRPGFDLHQPGAVEQLLEFHRATFGGSRMRGPEVPPGTDPTAGGTPPPADPPPPAGGTPPPADPPTVKGAGEAKFTQADLDRIIGERLKAEQKKFDDQLAAEAAKAGKSDLEKAQLEKTQAQEKLTSVQRDSAQRIARTEAKVAAIAAGANPDRLAAIVSMAILDTAVGDDGTVDEAAVKTAVEKVLTDFPEWKGSTLPAKSGSEIKPGGEKKPVFTRAQIKAMSQEERIRRVDELNEAAAEGRITA